MFCRRFLKIYKYTYLVRQETEYSAQTHKRSSIRSSCSAFYYRNSTRMAKTHTSEIVCLFYDDAVFHKGLAKNQILQLDSLSNLIDYV